MKPDPSQWQNRTVCVTGGSGFLGSHLVRQLHAVGARVRLLTLPPRDGHPLLAHPELEWFLGDLLDEQLVRRALHGCEVIFHTAGNVAVWGKALKRMYDVHVGGTHMILAHAPAQATIVHTSSIVAVGAHLEPRVLDEEAPFNLDTLPVDYVQAKHQSESLALTAAARGQRVLVVNPGYLLGPEDHELSVMGRMCLRFWKGRMFVIPASGYNLVDVRDVACGHLLAVERGLPGRRYILGGENRTLRAFLCELAGANGCRPRGLVPLPSWIMQSIARVAEWRAEHTGREPYPSVQNALLHERYWFVRSDRARRELGYQPRPLQQTIADTWDWFQAREPVTWRGFNRWWMRPSAA